MVKEKFQRVSFIDNAGKIAVALTGSIGLAAAVWGLSGRQPAPPQVIIVPNPAVSPTPSLRPAASPETRGQTLPTAPPPLPGNPNIQVWVNTETGKYHCPGTKWFKEKTRHGDYMTQKEAQERNYRPAWGTFCQ